MEERNNRAGLWITIVVAMPVIYVLSLGPVFWVLVNQLHVTNEPVWFQFFYYPLMQLADIWPAFGSAMEVYMKLWGVGI